LYYKHRQKKKQKIEFFRLLYCRKFETAKKFAGSLAKEKHTAKKTQSSKFDKRNR